MVGRFNLVEEPWITVMVNASGDTREVSLRTLFSNAAEYVGLAGETEPQNFALLRLLLAILHTVFSRWDENGQEYDGVSLDASGIQRTDVEEDDLEEYADALLQTWQSVWHAGRFPDVVIQYLEQWKDRFYLLDEKHPFFQVTKDEFIQNPILNPQKRPDPTLVPGKMVNRLLTESNRKITLFSPKYEYKDNKNMLTFAEIARWLVALQGYVGLADKTKFVGRAYKISKGWLYDLGGLYLQGRNLFQTLLLNLVLVRKEDEYWAHAQRPCWEFDPAAVLSRQLHSHTIDNLAELYTNWSRALYIDPEIKETAPFTIALVKLPDIDHVDNFWEPMTLWRSNADGENKDHYTPRKHREGQALWRSYGLIALPSSSDHTQKRPGVIEWYADLSGKYKVLNRGKVGLCAVSLKDDGNATSWLPAGEIYDQLTLSDPLLTDGRPEGWIVRVNDAIEQTKAAIEKTYRSFVRGILEIRNVKNVEIPNQEMEQTYFAVDPLFRLWMQNLDMEGSKAVQIAAWYETLQDFLTQRARRMLEHPSARDLKGRENQEETVNIITEYHRFRYWLNRQFEKGGKGGSTN